jgi:hypothetical protein
MLQRCPFYRDPRALVEHGIAAIVRMSQCEDLALALKAGQWLMEYGERLMNGKFCRFAEPARAIVGPLIHAFSEPLSSSAIGRLEKKQAAPWRPPGSAFRVSGIASNLGLIRTN